LHRRYRHAQIDRKILHDPDPRGTSHKGDLTFIHMTAFDHRLASDVIQFNYMRQRA
jgi:hypothetical protein